MNVSAALGGALLALGLAAASAAPEPRISDAGLDIRLGEALFERLWVASPSSTRASDGLGPYYNARSCRACHPANGRPAPPDGTTAVAPGLVLRLGLPAGPESQTFQPRPDPVYGRQLQDRAATGLMPEALPRISWAEETVRLPDGAKAVLRRPLIDPGLTQGPLAVTAALSPRLAPRLEGAGDFERIPGAEIAAGADPDDRDGDGVSGRPNLIIEPGEAMPRPGRYGHKATAPDLRAMVAAAFSTDLGLSSPDMPGGWGDCTPAQPLCRAMPHGEDAARDGKEVSSAALELVTAYLRSLPAPPSPASPEGAALFAATGCAACHRPAFPDGSGGTISTYSDFLLHDMGPGLADEMSEGLATGAEWRTAPLIGLSLTARKAGPSVLLHDGRARSLLEAILWHGGEAESARMRFVGLASSDRSALLRFLEGL